MPRHTLVAIVQDRPGVLHRAVSLLRRRGFNITSLVVGPSETPGVSRMTVVVEAESSAQVVQQLDRLVDVLSVHDVTTPQGNYRDQADGASGDEEAA
jgi:acetolactate synthase-1/3 small subunit